jgi:predicted O-methyltransferase YrrM
MGKIKLLIKYFVYRFRRKGAKGHGIHSPFLFEFNRNVLNNNYRYPEYERIRDFRRSLEKNRDVITVRDLGAGSLYHQSDKRRVKDILNYSSSSYKTGKLLFRIAKYLEPDNVIELGTSIGFGAFCLATGAKKAKVFSLEACPGLSSIARVFNENAGVENIEFIQGSFKENLPGILKKIERAELVYFDGDHRKEAVLWQYRQCSAKAGPDSIFIIGDIHWSPGMEEAWDIISNDPMVSISVDLFYCGLLLFRKGMAKQRFTLKYSD